MCTGGRIKHHLVRDIESDRNTIVFVGYQSGGTLGRRILDGEKEVRIMGRTRKVRAQVVRAQGFSGHGDRDELLRWIGGAGNKVRQVFVTHGGAQATQRYAETLKESLGLNASAPEYGDTVTLA